MVIKKCHLKIYCIFCLGRILNRFSKDMGTVDELVPIALIDCIHVIYFTLSHF